MVVPFDQDDFKRKVFPFISALGPYLYRDTLLLTKLIRIIRGVLKNSSTKSETFRYDVLSILNMSFLPACSLVESNSALGAELWSLLKLFPFSDRYLLYTSWKGKTNNPLTIKLKQLNMRKLSYVMKRISKDKESIKQSGRSIGKLSHSSPTYVFEYV